jgi:NAD(P)-dependent dehydrogenase (short-subunit alcohol dehydrogenase family)
MSVLAGRPPEGQTVAVLGGSGRMGAAVPEEVIGLGAGALLVGRDQGSLERTAASLGERARTVVADASDEDELRRVLSGHGSLDHIVVAVSAGRGPAASTTHLPGKRRPRLRGSGRATPRCTWRRASCRLTGRSP